MKVIFVIGSLSSGGAERVISEMSNYWAKRGWDVGILTTNVTKSKQDFYPLDSRVKRVNITMSKNFKKVEYFFNLVRGIRREIKREQPDVVISFISNLNIVSIISLFGLKIPLIISDRHNPYTDKIGFFYKKIFYPFSNILVLQTDGVKEFYKNISKLDIEVIPNPVKRYHVTKKEPKYKFDKKTICSVGRLNISLKGFDLLLEAFKLLEKKHPDWNLVIFGEGKDRFKLEELISIYNLKDRVFLPGKIENPKDTIVNADIFVLSSLEEGFPNVLLEAMSVGLPSISFDCNYGPKEIIETNRSGILVEVGNVKALSSAMSRLIESEKLRKKIGENAKLRVIEKFYIGNVMNQWETIIDRVLIS